MFTRMPQSVAIRVPLRAYLASDHVSAGTGVTVAVQVSKNGTAFTNPAAGATVATEIGYGWYYADLAADDLDTLGPLVLRATSATIDPIEVEYQIVDATNLGASRLDAAISTRSTFAGGEVASVADKTGYSLSSAGIAAIWAAALEGAYTAAQLVRGMAAAMLGKVSGAATTAVTIRDAADAKARITATVDQSGNRSAVTLDLD